MTWMEDGATRVRYLESLDVSQDPGKYRIGLPQSGAPLSAAGVPG